jgi:hypothetical protein
VIDPLVHFAGRTTVTFADAAPRTVVRDLAPYIDRTRRRVTSAGGELELDYDKGILALRAPSAQGAGGTLASEDVVATPDLAIRSRMEAGQILVVALDGKPLAASGRMLLQAMNEEKPTGWTTEPAADGRRRITSIGRDPWLVRHIDGEVSFRRPDAAKLRVRALDLQGRPGRAMGDARALRLAPDVCYYEITAP